ncbi:MAG TPA: carbon storage regulator CsrA [Bryobacteraceae bacterium]|jgi:carbon storage regulator
MLVIRRKAGEAFHIGDSIEVEILEVGSNQVKIGIKAPREIAVLRNEVYLTEHQNKAAATAAAALLGHLGAIEKSK